MGNRAIVVFHNETTNEISPSIYLHWNGGPESVYAFLDELDRRKCREFSVDFLAARFVHVVADYWDENGAINHSIGVENGPDEISVDGLAISHTHADSDNGAYVVIWHGSARQVRRFFSKEEKSPQWVEAEKERAYEHEYLRDTDVSIPAAFRRIRPVVKKGI